MTPTAGASRWGAGSLPVWRGRVGNVTGLSLMAPDLGGKRLELLKEVLPGVFRVGILWNAANPYSALSSRRLRASGPDIGN